MSEKNTTTAVQPSADDPRFAGLAEAEARMRANAEVPVLERYPDLVPRFDALMAEIPDAGADGAAALIDRLLEAESMEDFNGIWETDGLRDMIGQQIRVLAVRKSPSDFTSGLPYFLVLTIADGDTGEQRVITTGATAPVLTLGKLAARGMLPADIVPSLAKKRPGMEGAPINLRIVRTTRPEQ